MSEARMIGEHKMLHADPPSWCVACGTFEEHCVAELSWGEAICTPHPDPWWPPHGRPFPEAPSKKGEA